jgi:transcriptional regulator
MHPNPVFRKADNQRIIEFARARAFGALSINGGDGPLIAHIPFQLSTDGARLEGHVVRSNPLYRALENPGRAVLAISGGDGYVSPDWYGMDDQVPTWNYVAVHLRGTLRRLPEAELVGVLDRLSDDMERRLLPKPIWKMSKVSDGALQKMLRQIVPIAMDIDQLDGTWKLGQNKPDDARLGAASAMADDGFGLEYGAIAALMKNPPV